MRRTIIVISLCLLLGTITSVVIAWWFVLWSDFGGSSYEVREFEVNGWYGVVEKSPGFVGVSAANPNDHGETVVWDVLSAQRGFSRSPAALPSWVDFSEPPGETSEIITRAIGWPWQCLHSISERRERRLIWEWDFEDHGMLLGENPLTNVSKSWIDPRRLPVAPLWIGMLGNTAVFGAGWFVIALTGLPWRWWRVRRRRKRNLCQHCGYDRRSSTSPERCSECGRSQAERRPFFGAMSISALAMLCVVTGGVVIAFAVAFAATSPYSLIHYGAYRGDVETVIEQLSRGVDIEAVDTREINDEGDESLTPLAAAAAGGRAATVELLIDSGAEVNTDIHWKQSPLTLAMAHEDLEAARHLLEAGADPYKFSTNWPEATVLLEPARQGRVDVLELLVEYGFQAERVTLSLRVAASSGHREFVRRLLELGAPVTPHAMAGAVRSCDIQVLLSMIEYGGDPLSVKDGQTLLFSARSERDWLEICNLLIDAGVDVNVAAPNGHTALMEAVGDVELVRFLLDHGAGIRAVDGEGVSALFRAGYRGTPQTILLLLERGADPKDLRHSAWPWLGDDPPDKDHRDLVKRAVELGAPVTHYTMVVAVSSGDLELFQLMLRHDGDPLSEDPGGTLLADASSAGGG